MKKHETLSAAIFALFLVAIAIASVSALVVNIGFSTNSGGFTTGSSCTDGTANLKCSTQKPLYCYYGNLLKYPQVCGCPTGQQMANNQCSSTCNDGTLNGRCSTAKPYYCSNGNLVKNAATCGCPTGQTNAGGQCIVTTNSTTNNGNNDTSACQYTYNGKCVDKRTKIEYLIFEYTNVEREKYSLADLKWNTQLSSIARAHSEDMAAKNYFSHTSLDGKSPTQRAIDAGFDPKKYISQYSYQYGIGENIEYISGNIYTTATPESIATTFVTNWMNSPGHRANILSTKYSDIGVGFGILGTKYYGTQDFW